MKVYEAYTNLAKEKTALKGAIENAMRIPHYVSASDYLKKLYDAYESLVKITKKFDDQVQSYFFQGEAMIEGPWIYELNDGYGKTVLTLSRDKAVFLSSFADMDLVRYIVTYDNNGSKVINNLEGWDGEEFLA